MRYTNNDTVMRYLQQTTLFATLYPINNLGTIHENDLILYINRFLRNALNKGKKEIIKQNKQKNNCYSTFSLLKITHFDRRC